MAFLELKVIQNSVSSNETAYIVREDSDYFKVEAPDGSLTARLRKRSAYPGTYCRQIDSETIVLGYGEMQSSENDEYLQIHIRRGGHIEIFRDVSATLPLFFGQADNSFILSNDYAFVCKNLPRLTISREGTLHTLLLNAGSQKTIWNEIHTLGALQHLVLNERGGAIIDSTTTRYWVLSKDAPSSDPHTFARQFSQHLDTLTQKLSGQKVAYEVSGGLDSATLPLYIAARHGKTPGIGGYLLHSGAFGVSQQKKIQAVAEATGLSILAVPINDDDHGMLKHITHRHPEYHQPFHCSQDPHTHAISAMLDRFREAGADVVMTGAGGDDCLENIADVPEALAWGPDAQRLKQKKTYRSYFTQRAIDDYAAMSPSTIRPLPPLPLSIHSGNLSGNNIYIERDLWPVSPFINRGLYEYCQGLPVYFRSNKNILRLFHKAYRFPEAIYNTSQNEHFGEHFERTFFSDTYETLVKRYAQNSAAAALGYVDAEDLIGTYRQFKEEPIADRAKREEAIYHLYIWLCFEINAQMQQRPAGLATTPPESVTFSV